jgi:hypothetical protein
MLLQDIRTRECWRERPTHAVVFGAHRGEQTVPGRESEDVLCKERLHDRW